MFHGGQFAIMKKRVELTGYDAKDLGNGWILSWHEKVPVSICGNRMLIGHAWQAAPGKEDPAVIIERSMGIKELLREEETWCGRYVLIADGKIYLDACGLFGVFYSEDGVSSDLSFLAEAGKKTKKEWKPTDAIPWYPGPGTVYDGIRRLLPSQVYDYTLGQVSFRNILSGMVQTYKSEKELIEQFCFFYCYSLNRVRERFAGWQLMVELDGGYDSRTTLALAAHARLDFISCVLERAGMSAEDMACPPQLAMLITDKYEVYRQHPINHNRLKEEQYLEHIGRMHREEGRAHYAYGQYRELVQNHEKAVLLRSGIWDVARAFPYEGIVRDTDRRKLLKRLGIQEGSPEAASLEEYSEWCRQYQVPLPDANRFYWEEVCGSALAETEHGYDIYDDIISVQPLNCRALMTLLLQFPQESRKTKRYQEEIIRSVYPGLLSIPVGSSAQDTCKKFRLFRRS